jgi:hypothetical protein
VTLAVAGTTPDPVERAHLRLCGLVTLEVMLCFAVPAIALAVGAVYSPILLASAVMDPSIGLRPFTVFVLGSAGFVGIGRLLRLLWNPSLRDARPWLTLAAVACGAAASVVQVSGSGPGGPVHDLVIAYLPLACAAHLVFLNRRALLR